MRIRRRIIDPRFLSRLLLLCLLPVVWMRGATTPASEQGAFPAIQATSLENTKLHLPQEFAGQLNLVIISFAREQQPDVDSWVPAAQKIQAAHSTFHYYELSAMPHENPLYRWWFGAFLRSGTTNADLRGRILTAYVNRRTFRKSLKISNEKQVVAILVDRSGNIRWREDGACTEQKTTSLLSALTEAGI